MKNKSFVLIFCLLFFVSFVFAIPQSFNIHGKLTDSSGNPKTSAVQMNFSIYDAYTNGNLVWSTVKGINPDSNGVYSVILDDINLPFDEDYYLAIKVEDDWMSPRLNLTSAPYAFRAQNVSVGGVEFDGLVNLTSQNLWTTGNITAGYFFGSGKYLTDIETGSLNLSEVNYWTKDGTNLTYTEGNVGIGTTSPQGNLDIYGSEASLFLTNNNDNDWRILNLGTDNSLRFQYNLGSKITIDADGKVGIGTTSPTYKLEVSGSDGHIGLQRNIYQIGTTTQLDINPYQEVRFGRETNNAGFALSVMKGDDSTTINHYLKGSGNSYLAGNNGNVGIGTTSPGAKLEVFSGSSDVPMIIHRDSNTINYGAGITYTLDNSANTQTTYGSLYTIITDNTAGAEKGAMTFKLVNSGSVAEKMRITSDGKVGIGTTTPQNALNVIGDGNFTGTLTIANGTSAQDAVTKSQLDAINASASEGASQWTTNGSDIYYNTGNVGIGTTSPGYPLHIVSSSAWLGLDSSATSPYAGILLRDKGVGKWQVSIRESGDKLHFFDTPNSLSRMVITDTGNVGIGTTSPGQKLDVLGNITLRTAVNTDMNVDVSAGKYMWYVHDNSPGEDLEPAGEIDFIGTGEWTETLSPANIEFRLKTGADVLPSTKMVITNDGKVGIGTTSPTHNLEVQGTSKFKDTVSFGGVSDAGVITYGAAGLIVKGTSGNGLNLGADGDNYNMVIDTAGKVGIGTTTPQNALNVIGDGNFTGTLTIANGTSAQDAVTKSQLDAINASASEGASQWTTTGSDIYYNSGKVGIGTTSPDAFLEIASGSARYPTALRLTPTTYATSERVALSLGKYQFGQDWAGTGVEDFYIYNSADATRVLQVSAGNDIGLVPNSGRVGIGTTTPISKLHVNSNPTVDVLEEVSRMEAGGYGGLRFGVYPASSTSDRYAYIQSVQSSDTVRDLILQKDGGNVGIGTTSPVMNLHASSSTTSSGARVGGSNSDNSVFSYLWSGTSTSSPSIIWSSGQELRIGTVATIGQALSEKMRITDSGNVGIGTTSPLTNLHVDGVDSGGNFDDTDATAVFGSINGQQMRIGIDETNNYAWIESAEDGESRDRALVLNPSDGNVGIGTTTPDKKLEVATPSGTINAPSTEEGAVLRLRSNYQYESSYAGAGASLGKIEFYSADSSLPGASVRASIQANVLDAYNRNALSFSTANYNDVLKERMRIDNHGNVGIGTTSPEQTLHVLNSNNIVGMFENSNNNAGAFNSILKLKATSSTNMLDGYGGKIRFHIEDTAGVDNTIANIGAVRDGADNEGAIVFQAGTDGVEEFMTIKSSGKVGIGTTTPLKKFEVNGTKGGLLIDVDNTVTNMPTLNTTSGNMTITSMSGSVIIRLG